LNFDSGALTKPRKSQYETYLKKLDCPKNLKKKEWRAVHAARSKLSAKGIESRVKVSGEALREEELKRRMKHAFSGPEQSDETSRLSVNSVSYY